MVRARDRTTEAVAVKTSALRRWLREERGRERTRPSRSRYLLSRERWRLQDERERVAMLGQLSLPLVSPASRLPRVRYPWLSPPAVPIVRRGGA